MRRIYFIGAFLLITTGGLMAQVIQTYAGGGPNNIPAASAIISCPSSAVVGGSGTYYFTDSCQNRVYKVDGTGTITVVAGNGTPGFGGDGGLATSASLTGPEGVAVDSSGNVFIADSSNALIRRVDNSTGIITTVAGNGTAGFSGDGAAATSANLNFPSGVAVDGSGNLFIADSSNSRIRRVDNSTGIITTFAGNGTFGFSGDGAAATSATLSFPQGVAVDGSGNLFIADTDNSRIRRVDHSSGSITTVAGNGNQGFGGDSGPATSAFLFTPEGVAVDGSGNLFIADSNNSRIRRVDNSTGIITTVAGSGSRGFGGDGTAATSASLSFPEGVGVDGSGNLFIADSQNQRIRRVDAGSGNISTVVGGGSGGDGYQATDAVLFPNAVASDSSGNLFVADTQNQRVRRVDFLTGIITTVAGNGTAGFSGDGGAATSASLNSPVGVAVDGFGNLFIADLINQRIRRVDHTSGIITTVAGSGNMGFAGDGGSATSASLSSPEGVAADGFGNLFIADQNNNRIRRVDRSSGIITTVAGTHGNGFFGDGGPATSAGLFNTGGVAVDGSGNLFIADTNNHRIRRVDAVTGIITTVAGDGIAAFTSDGIPAISASLSFPRGVAIDSGGNVFIADTGNSRIRRVDQTTGIITTVAGTGDFFFGGDGGLAVSADLSSPFGIAFGSGGNLFIADLSNQRVRLVSLSSALSLSPTSLIFGNQNFGTTSSPMTATLTNNSSASILLGNIATSGTFAVAGNTCGSSLAAGASCMIMVTFTPLAAVTETGLLTVTSFGGIIYTAGLQGQGVVPSGGSGTITGVTAGSGLTGGGTTGTLSLSVDSTVARTNLANMFTMGQTVNGTVSATSFSGSGATLTSLSPANIAAGTAAINITGSAATAATATNATSLGGVAAASYARLNTANVFTGNQSVTGNISATGSVAIGGGTPITLYTSATYAISVPSLKKSACTSLNETLAGVVASANDTIALGLPNSLLSGNGMLMFQAWESAANTITIRVCNVDPSQNGNAVNGTIRIDVFKH